MVSRRSQGRAAPDLGAIVRGLAIVGYPLADEAFTRVSIRFRRVRRLPRLDGGRMQGGQWDCGFAGCWFSLVGLGVRRELDGGCLQTL